MRDRIDNLLYVLLLVAIALLVGFLGTRWRFVHDFSEARRASLGESSRQVLQGLAGPVEIVSYARRDGELRPAIREFIERYRLVKPDISLRFIDPDADPAAMREAGVQLDGELEVRHAGRSERLRALGEAELSSALLRLSRTQERIVAFLEGEGERRADGQANADLGQFGALLAGRGVRIVHIALATTPRIADNVDLVVIANPRIALPAAAAAALVDHVARGGNLLWLLEPGEEAGLDALAAALAVRALPGVLVDGSGQQFGLGDPSFVAVSRYPAHAATRGFELATLFPQPLALAQVTPSEWTFAALLQSSAQSWNEVGHIPKAGEPEGNVRYDGSDGEMPGPHDFAVALTRAAARADAGEQRVVVVGDGDFLSNSFLGNAGNREFGRRLFDWLLADDALVEVPDRSARDRTLDLSQGALSALSVGFLVVLPVLLATSGLLVWRRRRRR